MPSYCQQSQWILQQCAVAHRTVFCFSDALEEGFKDPGRQSSLQAQLWISRPPDKRAGTDKDVETWTWNTLTAFVGTDFTVQDPIHAAYLAQDCA